MRYNVAQLLRGPVGEKREYALDEEIGFLDQEIDPVRRLAGSVSLIRTSQGILVTGRLRTALRVVCRRCLEPSQAEVELDLEEEFYPTVPMDGAALDRVLEEELDEAALIDEYHILDLGEVIRQELLMAVPMGALCRPDCAGLCSRCGGNRNLGECQCEESLPDPRWAELAALLAPELESTERSD
mgnify:CR=1 FL=1